MRKLLDFYTSFFLFILFCAVVPLLNFYTVWGIKELLDAEQISHRVPCFHIKVRAEGYYCGTCRVEVKLTTSIRELWKWVLMPSSAGNVKGFSDFSFLWLKFYFYSLCQKKKKIQNCCSCCPSAQHPMALGRPFSEWSLGTTLKCLNGVKLKWTLKCP